MKKKNLTILIGGVVAAALAYLGYRYYSKTKPAVGPGAMPETIVETVGSPLAAATLPRSAGTDPPPGYSGPTGGPYQWGGMGDPPDGIYTINYI